MTLCYRPNQTSTNMTNIYERTRALDLVTKELMSIGIASSIGRHFRKITVIVINHVHKCTYIYAQFTRMNFRKKIKVIFKCLQNVLTILLYVYENMLEKIFLP